MNTNLVDFSAPLPSEQGESVVYPNRLLFRAGKYDDKEFSLTADEMRRAEGDAPVPLDLNHTSTLLDGKLGHCTNRRVVMEKGEAVLRGDIVVPKWLVAQLPKDGQTKMSTTWKRDDKTLFKIALLDKPRIPDAVLMAAFSAANPDWQIPVEEMLTLFRQYTWTGAQANQACHDVIANCGGICQAEMDGTAEFITNEEFKHFQKLHALTKKGGAKCHVRDDSDPQAHYFRAGKEPDTMSKPVSLLAKFAAFLRGKGVKVEDASLIEFASTAEFLGGGGTLPGQNTNTDNGTVNAANGEGQMPGGESALKKKKKKAAKVAAMAAQATLDQAVKQAIEAQFGVLRTDIAQVGTQVAASDKSTQTTMVVAAIDKLVKEFRVSPAQGKLFKEQALSDPVGFSKFLPALQQMPPNPAVVGFSSKEELPAGVDADQVVMQLNSESPDVDLATFAATIQKENPTMKPQEALAEAARRYPALVQARAAKTPKLG